MIGGIYLAVIVEYVLVSTIKCYFNPLALELDIYSLAHHLCKV